jgi:hypothetical protein
VKNGWEYGSSDRMLAYQVHGPEFNLQSVLPKKQKQSNAENEYVL